MTQYIRYIGLSHIRMITADEFRQAGLNMQTVTWSAHNNFSVPIDMFPDDVLERVIKEDQYLVVVGGHEYAPRDLGHDMTPAQAAAPRIDMMGAVGAFPGGQPGPFTGSGPSWGGSAAPTTTSTGPGSGSD